MGTFPLPRRSATAGGCKSCRGRVMRGKRGATLMAALVAAGGGAAVPAIAQQQIASADINTLSIEQLGNVEITSVSKRAQPLSDAPAAIYVISHDDIVRSGAMSIP